MKLLALIIQLLVWLLVAFACVPKAPVTPAAPIEEAGNEEAASTPAPTKWAVATVVIEATPTPAPAEVSKSSGNSKSSKHRSSSSSDDDDDDYVEPDRTRRPGVDPEPEGEHSGEDTLMPEIGGDDDDGDSGDHGYYSDDNIDTLLPEI